MIVPLEGPKMFHMIRRSKPVAEVFITHEQQAVLAWMGQCTSIAIYPSFVALKTIHGHKSESGLDDTSFEPQDTAHMMRYVCDIMQDHAENAMVPASIADALRQALSEVSPNHPTLKGENPSYGVWAGQRREIDRLRVIETEYRKLTEVEE